MRLKSMHAFTDALPLVQWKEHPMPQLLGKSTIASMISGAVHGIIGEMNTFISSYKTQYSALKVVLTGGDANFFEKELKNGIFADPNLVLKGLNEILVYNRE
jgi:type III pantothenate kinase